MGSLVGSAPELSHHLVAFGSFAPVGDSSQHSLRFRLDGGRGGEKSQSSSSGTISVGNGLDNGRGWSGVSSATESGKCCRAVNQLKWEESRVKRILALAVVVVVLASCWGVKVDPSSSPVAPTVVKVVRETVVVERTVVREVAQLCPTAITTTVKQAPTQTITVTATTKGPDKLAGSAALSESLQKVQVGDWELRYYKGATEQVKGWPFASLEPEKWPTFPNQPNPLVPEFRVKIVDEVETVPDGLEYGIEESDFCQTPDSQCRFPVAARHYRIITADYDIGDIGKCAYADNGVGCALMIINIGNVTSVWEGKVDMGFTVTGSYFNGDVLNEAIVAGLSHTANRMMNLADPDATNPGSNCSSPEGCDGVDIKFIIIWGNEILMSGHTVVHR